VNKFDALKQFQGWPPEWQRLCAECFIETGEDRPAVQSPPCEPINFDVPKTVLTYPREAARVAATPCDIEARFRNGQPVSIPFGQPKAAAKVAAKPIKIHSRLAWSAAESEYLLKLASEDQPLWNVVAFFLSRYPGRSRDAVRRRVWGIRSGKPESEVKY
jgi:hypothetical protein